MSDTPVSDVTPPTLYRPTWADPGFVLSTNDYAKSVVTINGGTIVRVAKNNPKRWAIGFFPRPGLTAGASVAPWPDTGNGAIPVPDANGHLWLTLFSYGPMVTSEWYGQSMIGGDVCVVEVEIH